MPTADNTFKKTLFRDLSLIMDDMPMVWVEHDLKKIIATKKYVAFHNTEKFNQSTNYSDSKIIGPYLPLIHCNLTNQSPSPQNYELLKEKPNLLPFFCEYEFSTIKQLQKMMPILHKVSNLINENISNCNSSAALTSIRQNILRDCILYFHEGDDIVNYLFIINISLPMILSSGQS